MSESVEDLHQELHKGWHILTLTRDPATRIAVVHSLDLVLGKIKHEALQKSVEEICGRLSPQQRMSIAESRDSYSSDMIYNISEDCSCSHQEACGVIKSVLGK
jgi:hypothetical protein